VVGGTSRGAEQQVMQGSHGPILAPGCRPVPADPDRRPRSPGHRASRGRRARS
jgi:hypothetical protein